MPALHAQAQHGTTCSLTREVLQQRSLHSTNLSKRADSSETGFDQISSSLARRAVHTRARVRKRGLFSSNAAAHKRACRAGAAATSSAHPAQSEAGGRLRQAGGRACDAEGREPGAPARVSAARARPGGRAIRRQPRGRPARRASAPATGRAGRARAGTPPKPARPRG